MEGHQANGAFVACGPPGFTALALINLGSQARKMSEVTLSLRPGCADAFFYIFSVILVQTSAAQSRLSSRWRDLVLLERAYGTSALWPFRLLFRIWHPAVLVQSPQTPQ